MVEFFSSFPAFVTSKIPSPEFGAENTTLKVLYDLNMHTKTNTNPSKSSFILNFGKG